jgi:hypothetical protein
VLQAGDVAALLVAREDEFRLARDANSSLKLADQETRGLDVGRVLAEQDDSGQATGERGPQPVRDRGPRELGEQHSVRQPASITGHSGTLSEPARDQKRPIVSGADRPDRDRRGSR